MKFQQHPGSGTASDRNGYSLMEMLLVLALIGLLAALLVPSLEGPLAAYRIEQAAGDVRARLGNARLRAMESGQPHALVCFPGTGRYELWPLEETQPRMRERYSIEGSRLSFAPDNQANLQASRNAASPYQVANFSRIARRGAIPIVFLGDGTAVEDVRFRIQDRNSRRDVAIAVTALTGSVRIVSTARQEARR